MVDQVTDQTTYRVIVTREKDAWLADVPQLEGSSTYARSLPALDKAVREVIVLGADLPDEAMDELALDYVYRTGDPRVDELAARVRRERAQIAAVEEHTAQAARELSPAYSLRDAGMLLGISYQRVSQLVDPRERRRGARKSSRPTGTGGRRQQEVV